MAPFALPPCPTAPAAGGWHYGLYLSLVLLYAVGVFTLITWSGTRGRWWLTVLGVWLASAIPLALIATQWEGRSLRPLLDSWALKFGDPLALPILLGVCAAAWAILPRTGWYRTRRWLIAAVLIGIGASALFHLGEIHAYDIYRLHSPSKVLHDWASYPVLMSAAVYLVVPVLASPRRVGWWRWAAVLALAVVMIVILVHEATHSLGPAVYHPQADWNHWGQVITCSF